MAAVITPEAALAAGIAPASLRQVAAWNFEAARHATTGFSVDPVAAERHRAQAAAAMKAAHDVERLAGRKSRRRAA